MRIGVNAVIVGRNKNSFSYYCAKTVPGLFQVIPDKLLFVAGKGFAEEYVDPSRLSRLQLHCGAGEGKTAQVARYAWQRWGMRAYEQKHALNLWYSPTHHGRTVSGVPQVITIHDLIALRFPTQNPVQTQFFKEVLPQIIRNSVKVIVNSQATKSDVINTFGIDAAKVETVYLGFDHTFAPQPEEQQAEKNLILLPGAAYPHKNAARIIQAFAQLGERYQDLHLVITGAGKQQALLEKQASLHGVGHRCEVYTYLPEQAMQQIWQKTRLVVYASLWEGFGIPPLEAMGRGVPCIASNLASLPEVCGDAVVYVNPYDIEDIAAKMELLLTDLSLVNTLLNQGRRRIKVFDWSQAVNNIANVLTSCLE